jgi:hypothetical protein
LSDHHETNQINQISKINQINKINKISISLISLFELLIFNISIFILDYDKIYSSKSQSFRHNKSFIFDFKRNKNDQAYFIKMNHK